MVLVGIISEFNQLKDVMKRVTAKVLHDSMDKVIFKDPAVRDNQYALQVHMALVNGLLGSVGLNVDDIHLLHGADLKNSKGFLVELSGGGPVWVQAEVSDQPISCPTEVWPVIAPPSKQQQAEGGKETALGGG